MAMARRRDFIRTSLAAIGLSWSRLDPVGAEVDIESAARERSINDFGLVQPGALDSGPSVVDGQHSVRLLTDDAADLPYRLGLIESASREVLLASYEIGDDPVVLRLLAALRHSARRGVCVKLLVDGHAQNNLIPKPMMEYLIGQGVLIREHMPDVRYQVELGRQRMHDKLLVVDGTSLIIGGRNMRADYYGMADMNMRDSGRAENDRLDRELHVVGPVVQHAHTYFLARWNAGTSGQPSLTREEKRKTAAAQQLHYLNDMPRQAALARSAALLDRAAVATLPASHIDSRYPPARCRDNHWYPAACMRFLHDIPEHAKDEPAAIANQLNQVISCARHCILIETPYAVFTKDLRGRLTDARRRGVNVCVLTNSLQTTDQVIAHAQYANERRWLRDAGIQLWELKGERHLHSKAMIVDHQLSMIGSYNFDVLAETRNSEVAVLIDDVTFAKAFGHQIARHLLMSEPVPEDEPLFGYDARNNEVEDQVLREARIKRLLSPWIKRYL